MNFRFLVSVIQFWKLHGSSIVSLSQGSATFSPQSWRVLAVPGPGLWSKELCLRSFQLHPHHCCLSLPSLLWSKASQVVSAHVSRQGELYPCCCFPSPPTLPGCGMGTVSSWLQAVFGPGSFQLFLWHSQGG